MLEKIATILAVATKPALKSHIIAKCTLVDNQVRYITELVEAGLLDAYPAIDLKLPGPRNHHRMVYQTSRKGKEFLKQYNDLVRLLEPLEKADAGCASFSVPSPVGSGKRETVKHPTSDTASIKK